MRIVIKSDQFVRGGKILRLAGNHTWNTVQRVAGEKIGIDKLTGNFTRLWPIETSGIGFAGSQWGSSTPGIAKVDNVPWNTNGSLNKGFYRALEGAVRKADKRDMITGVVLFEGTFHQYPDYIKGWDNHPFNGLGPEAPELVHTKGKWNKYQRAHVKEVVKRLEGYDNVIYEVGNELHRNSVGWFQGKVVQWIKKWTDKPVGVSYAQGMKPSAGRSQDWLTKQGADWIAPAGAAKIAGFNGPQVLDTDHAWPLQSNVGALRSAWAQGRALWLMDGFNGTMLRNQESLAGDRAFIDSVV